MGTIGPIYHLGTLLGHNDVICCDRGVIFVTRAQNLDLGAKIWIWSQNLDLGETNNLQFFGEN